MTVAKPKMINVKTPLTKYVTSGKRSKTTKVAWHYTGAHDVSAKSTVYNWFLPIAQGKHPKNYASAHFVVDLNGDIYSMIPLNYVAYTTNSANSYSIGIECATTGKDDHYTKAEYEAMVHLGAWLAQYYKLDPRKDFIRHYDVTGKICPRYFVNNTKAWKQFKQDCYDYMIGKSEVITFKQYYVRVNVDGLNCRKGAGVNYDIECVLNKGEVFTVIAEKNGWVKAKSGYWVNKKYVDFIRYV